MLNPKKDAFLVFKRKLISREPVFGIALRGAETAVAELTAMTGFDFAWIDMEHSTLTFKDAERLIVTLENKGCVPLVRVPENNANAIGQVLDLGARIVNVPHIETAQDAAMAVKAAKYFPAGKRGISSCSRSNSQGLQPLDQKTMKITNAQNLVMVQIESAEALANLDSIAATQGVDILFLGLGDLSQDIGLPGQHQAPVCRRAIKKTGAAIQRAGRIGALFADTPQKTAHYRTLGFSMFICGIDVLLAKNALRQLHDELCGCSETFRKNVSQS